MLGFGHVDAWAHVCVLMYIVIVKIRVCVKKQSATTIYTRCYKGARRARASDRLREGRIQVEKRDEIPLIHTRKLLPHLLHLLRFVFLRWGEGELGVGIVIEEEGEGWVAPSERGVQPSCAYLILASPLCTHNTQTHTHTHTCRSISSSLCLRCSSSSLRRSSSSAAASAARTASLALVPGRLL